MAAASLSLSTARASIAPGGRAEIEALITNQAADVAYLRLAARGVDPTWLSVQPQALALAPAEQARATVVLSPPAGQPNSKLTLTLQLIESQSGTIVAQAALPVTVSGAATAAVPAMPASEATTARMAPRPSSGPAWLTGPVLAIASAALLLVVLLVAVAGYLLFFRGSGQPKQVSAGAAQICADQTPARLVQLFSDDRTTAILSANPDLSDLRILRSEPGGSLPGLFGSLLALSGNGAKLAYVTAANPQLDEAHLWSIDVANPANRSELAYVPKGLWPAKPAWSPDGRRLAFIRLNEQAAAQGTSQFELWVVEPGAPPRSLGTLRALQPQFFYGDRPVPFCWAIDNQTLIFQTLAPDGRTTTTQTEVNVETRAVTRVALTPSASPVIEPSPPAATEPAVPTPAPIAGTSCGVPVFSQNDPGWRQFLMKAAGDDIGNFGCALTSTTMLLNYYGASLNPAQLNQCLGDYADPLYWGQAPRCTNGVVGGGNQLDFSWQRLDQVLAAGQPAIVGMIRGQTGMHFVVVTGGGGGLASNYAVTDPWDGTTNKTLASFIGSGYNPRWVITYDGPGRNCVRVSGPSAATDAGMGTLGVSDGGVYHDQVTLQPPDGSQTELIDLSLDQPSTGTATPGSRPAGSPSASPGAGAGFVAIVNQPVPSRPVTPGMVLRDEGVYQLIIRRPSTQGLTVERVKFTIDRTPPLVSLADASAATPAAAVPGLASLRPMAPAGARPAAAPGEYRDRAAFQIQAVDQLSGVVSIEYQFDNEGWKLYSNDISFKQLLLVSAPGQHTLAFRATDLAQNQSALGSYSFTIIAAGAPAAPGTPTASPPAITQQGPQPTATVAVTPTEAAPTATTRPAAPTATSAPRPKIEVDPTTVRFGALGKDGDSELETIYVYNDGPNTLTVEDLVFGGAYPKEFYISIDNCTDQPLEEDDECDISFYYHPTISFPAPTDITATLTIKSNAANGPQTVKLIGAAVVATPTPRKPNISFKPTEVDFGRQTVGQASKPTVVAAISAGDAPLTISRVSINGLDKEDFSVDEDNCSKAQLQPGQSCTVRVSFKPLKPGERQAGVHFESNVEGSPHAIPVKGTGVEPPSRINRVEPEPPALASTVPLARRPMNGINRAAEVRRWAVT